MGMIQRPWPAMAPLMVAVVTAEKDNESGSAAAGHRNQRHATSMSYAR